MRPYIRQIFQCVVFKTKDVHRHKHHTAPKSGHFYPGNTAACPPQTPIHILRWSNRSLFLPGPGSQKGTRVTFSCLPLGSSPIWKIPQSFPVFHVQTVLENGPPTGVLMTRCRLCFLGRNPPEMTLGFLCAAHRGRMVSTHPTLVMLTSITRSGWSRPGFSTIKSPHPPLVMR